MNIIHKANQAQFHDGEQVVADLFAGEIDDDSASDAREVNDIMRDSFAGPRAYPGGYGPEYESDPYQ